MERTYSGCSHQSSYKVHYFCPLRHWGHIVLHCYWITLFSSMLTAAMAQTHLKRPNLIAPLPPNKGKVTNSHIVILTLSHVLPVIGLFWNALNCHFNLRVVHSWEITFFVEWLRLKKDFKIWRSFILTDFMKVFANLEKLVAVKQKIQAWDVFFQIDRYIFIWKTGF